MALNHIHLKVRDVATVRRFYEMHFGFRMVEENPVEAYLSDSHGSWLTLSAATDADAPLPQWFHFGFCYDTPEQVEHLYEELKAIGARFARDLTYFGDDGLTFYVLDPCANKVEVSWIKSRLRTNS